MFAGVQSEFRDIILCIYLRRPDAGLGDQQWGYHNSQRLTGLDETGVFGYD